MGILVLTLKATERHPGAGQVQTAGTWGTPDVGFIYPTPGLAFWEPEASSYFKKKQH